MLYFISLLAELEGYISLKNGAVRHCVGALKTWLKLQKQNYLVFLLAVNPSFLFLYFFSSAFFVICWEMFFKPLFALAKHSVNVGFCHGNLSCIWAIQFAYSWAFWKVLFILYLPMKGSIYPYSRWWASGWSNHWTCSSRVVSVYTLFFAVFQ